MATPGGTWSASTSARRRVFKRTTRSTRYRACRDSLSRASASSNVFSAVSLKMKNGRSADPVPMAHSMLVSRDLCVRNAAMLPGVASMLIPRQPRR